MDTITVFRVGELYTNDQIRFALAVENLGGIRPSVDSSKKLRHLVIMTASEESDKVLVDNPYYDRIEGDILLYTAQGREGDQQISGRNKRLIEQYMTPVPFYGFMNLGRQTYRFLGLLELLRHYQEVQVDKRGNLRKVWLFELRIHGQPEIVPIDQASVISSYLLSESRKQNLLFDLERQVTDKLPGGMKQTDTMLVSPEIEILRSQLTQIMPYKFEQLVRAIMDVNGFRNVSVTAASGDGGIDLDAYVDDSNDFFAGTHVQVQVKRWRHAVGSIEINNFRGALSTTAKGVFVTTSHYTRAAMIEAQHKSKPCITLINGNRLSTIITRSSLDIKTFL